MLSGAPAFGQQSLLGAWELAGYMCSADGNLIPMGDSTQEFVFRHGGELKVTYHKLPGSDDEMTPREVWERSVREAKERVERWHQDDIGGHEEACRNNPDDDNLCSRRGKADLYDEWRGQRDRELAQMLEEIGEEPGEESQEPCKIVYSMGWSASRGALTITQKAVEATDSCGYSSGVPQRLSLRFYFDEGNLHFIMPAKGREEDCGSQDTVAIFFRK